MAEGTVPSHLFFAIRQGIQASEALEHAGMTKAECHKRGQAVKLDSEFPISLEQKGKKRVRAALGRGGYFLAKTQHKVADLL